MMSGPQAEAVWHLTSWSGMTRLVRAEMGEPQRQVMPTLTDASLAKRVQVPEPATFRPDSYTGWK